MAFLAGSAGTRIVSTDPSADAALGREAPCTVRFAGLPLHAALSVDGHPLDSRIDLTRWTVTSSLCGLSEGHHQLKVEVDSALVKDARVVDFIVDTTPPTIGQIRPRSGSATRESVTNIVGETEPLARVSVEDASGKALDLVQADADGAFTARVQLADGANKLTLAAKDRAGNSFRTAWSIFVDRQPPTVRLAIADPPLKPQETEPRAAAQGDNLIVGSPLKGEPCRDGETLKVDALNVTVAASDDDRVAGCRYSIDDASPRKLKLVRHGREWLGQVSLRDLPEGDRTLNVTVTDRVGHRTEQSWRFNVDSTEEFGRKTMTLGARGKDVEALQNRLIEAGAWSGPVTSVFDQETEEAVRQLKSQQGIEPDDGVAGPSVLSALGPRIFVNLARLELVLDRPGKDPMRYRIACGMDGHGTPTGKFTIVDKEANPPWMPPPSPWAKGAKVIPPGPGNPLGTRWLGLDHGGVGIHGTNAPWSIGSRSSHGCIRMKIPDIESLFALVDPGTPVLILASAKSDPAAEKLWP